jgi:hypothetical protein
LKKGQIQTVLQELAPHREADSLPDEQAPVRCAIRYLTHRMDCLDYPEAIANNLPIGSGLIESSHKHVIQQRLKQPGAAWLTKNAESMAQLRVLRANQHWNSLWPQSLAA